jgi:cysteine synthase
MIYTSVSQLVGGTPLLELSNIEKELGLKARVLVKLEGMNPAGSAKDRIARCMLDEAEADGTIKPSATIIEPTSGNTGIGLASIGASRGYKVIIVMPDSMSVERIKTMQGYGAEVVLTPGSLGMAGAVEKANEIQAETPGSWVAGQFSNPSNPKAHYQTTGPEIWHDTEGSVNIFVAGIGTGGTISGVGAYLKEQNPTIEIYGVEPDTSPLLTKGYAGPHGIQGIGANFVPETLNKEIYDDVLTATLDDSYKYARMVGHKEGVLVGISSGAAVWAAIELAKKPENEGKTIVALLADDGSKYLSTALFE